MFKNKDLEKLELTRFLPIIFLVEVTLVTIVLYLLGVNERSNFKFFAENPFFANLYSFAAIFGYLVPFIYFTVMSFLYAKLGKRIRLVFWIILTVLSVFFFIYSFYLISGGNFSIFTLKGIGDNGNKASIVLSQVIAILFALVYPVIHFSFLGIYLVKKLLLKLK